MYFGRKKGEFKLPDYSYEQIKWYNAIPNSSMFRRGDYDRIYSINGCGYNINMKSGYEDWDLWLSILSPESQVHRIEEFLFFYRVLDESRSTQAIKYQYDLWRQLVRNHPDLYSDNLEEIVVYHNDSQYYKYRLEQIKNSTVYKILKFCYSPIKPLVHSRNYSE